MAIKIPKETEKALLVSIRRFFAETLEEEIGDLKAQLVLDYCLREIGPTVYNAAVRDSQAYLQERVADLDGTCFEPELTYWKSRRDRGR